MVSEGVAPCSFLNCYSDAVSRPDRFRKLLKVILELRRQLVADFCHFSSDPVFVGLAFKSLEHAVQGTDVLVSKFPVVLFSGVKFTQRFA